MALGILVSSKDVVTSMSGADTIVGESTPHCPSSPSRVASVFTSFVPTPEGDSAVEKPLMRTTGIRCVSNILAGVIMF